MRVLVLSPVFPPARGGIETLSWQIATRLRGEVLVVTLASETANSRDTAEERLTTSVLRVPNVPAGGRRAILRVNARAVRAGRRFAPDVILVMHVKLAPAAVLLNRRLGVPFVQYVHAKEMREVPGLARLGVQEAEAVVAVSSYSAKLAYGCGASRDRIRVIHNGVELPRIVNTMRETRPTLISVSRLEDRYKGHDVFLRALPAIRRVVPDVQWLVIGEGARRPELESLARSLSLESCVKFLGAVTNAERDRYLSRAWAFVMLSRQPPGRRAGEGFGIAYIEAGAHGLPAIAGSVPGVTDAVQHEVSGLLVDPTSAHDAAAATLRLLTEEGLARRLGAGGLARAATLQWPGIVAQVEELLELSVSSSSSRTRGAPEHWLWARELLLGASSDVKAPT